VTASPEKVFKRQFLGKAHFGTHLPMLAAALMVTRGPVLELGTGFWSTPTLHQLCWDRELVTVETVDGYRDLFAPLATEKHSFSDHLSPAILDSNWAVVLVDNEADQRGPALRNVHFDLAVVHDTEPNKPRDLYPGMHEALEQFEFRYDMDEMRPQTTLVSHRTHAWTKAVMAIAKRGI